MLALDDAVCNDLPDSERKHLRALHVEVGETTRLVDGKGNARVGILSLFDKDNCIISELLETPTNEPLQERILLISQIDPTHLETAVGLLVPLGVTQIVILHTQYSQLLPRFRVQRHTGIAIAAMKQCNRSRIPKFDFAEDGRGWKLVEVLDNLPSSERFLADSAGEPVTPKLLSELNRDTNLVIAVGPEGGLTDQERVLLLSYEFRPISLGARILRTELASATALAKLSDDK